MADAELDAISTLLSVLEPLDPAARVNVIEYVFRRLGITAPFPTTTKPPKLPDTPPAPLADTAHARVPPPHIQDIRSFAQEKHPRTASERAAVVAYYLAHLAPGADQQNYITAEDITKYFAQAHLPLPASSPMTLVHAKNAGYLDQQERGHYRLNPVGHNLVVHRLPQSEGKSVGRRVPAKRNAKKKSRRGARG